MKRRNIPKQEDKRLILQTKLIIMSAETAFLTAIAVKCIAYTSTVIYLYFF